MKIWCAKIHDADMGTIQVWAGSQREVRRLALEAARGDKTTIAAVHAVNVPTDRKGLIRWLNIYFNTDNG